MLRFWKLTRSSSRALASESRSVRHTSSISALQAAFKDPSSPFHIAPGEHGPESPDSPPTTRVHSHAVHMSTLASSSTAAADDLESGADALRQAAVDRLLRKGFDPKSFWEQVIAWGDQDPFQHVNNVRYVRFFESARIKWMMKLGEEIGGLQKAQDMLKGKGVSLILKSIDVQFRRPVTFPDTLLIGYKPTHPPEGHTDVATFFVTGSAYSLSQKAFVAHSREALVWYDYDSLKKCVPGERELEILNRKLAKKS